MLIRERDAANTITPYIPGKDTAAPPEAMALDNTTKDIIAHLTRVGPASIREIRAALDIPTRTALRKLTHLHKCGFVQRSGATTAVRYALAASPRNGVGVSGVSHAAFREPGEQCNVPANTTA